MPEPNDYTSYWMKAILRISEPMTIGKHEWRLVQYRDTSTDYVTDEASGVGRFVDVRTTFVGYEWRRLGERYEYWRQARDWPKYDFNDGMYLGLPRTLRKLYEACPWAHGDPGSTAQDKPSGEGEPGPGGAGGEAEAQPKGPMDAPPPGAGGLA